MIPTSVRIFVCTERQDMRRSFDALALAVKELSGDGDVIPVRLSLFADMMKKRSWTPDEFAKVGGTKGVGVKFLEDIAAVPITDTTPERTAKFIKDEIAKWAPVIRAAGVRIE